MIQNLETTLKAGAVPQVPQFRPVSVAQPTADVKSSAGQSNAKEADGKLKSEGQPSKSKEQSTSEKSVEAKPKSVANGVVDPLGNARSKVQEEITAEFAAIMATGTLRASEAAALATRRVMEKYGHGSSAMTQS